MVSNVTGEYLNYYEEYFLTFTDVIKVWCCCIQALEYKYDITYYILSKWLNKKCGKLFQKSRDVRISS